MYGHVITYFDEDPLNTFKNRNIKNTLKSEYNCAGYALGCFSWYIPDGVDDWETMAEKTCRAVKSMLHDFSCLRVISDLSELMPDEQAIAFRVEGTGYLNDFHYILRGKNGHWTHKMGSCSFIGTMTQKEVFSDCWLNRYIGPIVLFARKTS